MGNQTLYTEVFKPKSLLLHIPHSSIFIPNSFGKIDDKLLENIKIQTDSFTDDIFFIKDTYKIKTLKFNYNRYYCDVERYFDDNLEEMSKVGQGVRYVKFSDGTNISDRIDTKDDIKSFYSEHHRLFNLISKELVELNDNCLIIDCHSFNDKWLPIETNYRTIAPDICIGVNDEDLNLSIINDIIKHFESYNLTVAVNFPYKGSIYPSEFKNSQLKSVMIEINKKLYLKNEYGFEKDIDKFNKLKNIINSLLTNIIN